MNILEATKSYEDWMRKCTVVVESQIRDKHENMKKDLFTFFRGTYYRWAQLWSELSVDLRNAPRVLAVADLHIDSFGTWRDLEGRLVWGVDDFDESFPISYANDLVRLATSVKIVIDSEVLTVGLRDACDVILSGYESALKQGGCPFVLAEDERNLEKLGIKEFKPPKDFWLKLNQLPAPRHTLPGDAKQALESTLPGRLDYRIVRRQAGTGSLGRQRFVAIGQWKGGNIAREAKAMIPSACTWIAGGKGLGQSYYQQAIEGAVRSHDPFQKLVKGWLIRRLSPDSNPIEIMDWPARRDENILLRAMGSEVANVHLGSPRQIKRVLKDLRQRKADWLRSAAKQMARTTEREWTEFNRS